MNILKKILYGILIFFMLCCGIIFLCAMNPDLSGKIADTLHLDEDQRSNVAPTAGTGSPLNDDGGIYGGQIQNNDNENENADDTEIPEEASEQNVTERQPTYVIGPDIEPESKPKVQDVDTRETAIPYRITDPPNVAG